MLCSIPLASNRKTIYGEFLNATYCGVADLCGLSAWNERHTLWSELGTAPTMIEPVKGWVMLRNIEGAVGMTVTALDGSARPLGVPIAARRLEEGWEFPMGDVATTTYVIRPIR